jgi:hypothetical protein
MTDMSKKTKAEIIKDLEQYKKELEEYKKKEAELQKVVQVDLTFKATEKEQSEKEKNQARKDYIKRMTNGRWTSEEKYQDYIKKNQVARVR